MPLYLVSYGLMTMKVWNETVSLFSNLIIFYLPCGISPTLLSKSCISIGFLKFTTFFVDFMWIWISIRFFCYFLIFIAFIRFLVFLRIIVFLRPIYFMCFLIFIAFYLFLSSIFLSRSDIIVFCLFHRGSFCKFHYDGMQQAIFDMKWLTFLILTS